METNFNAGMSKRCFDAAFSLPSFVSPVTAFLLYIQAYTSTLDAMINT